MSIWTRHVSWWWLITPAGIVLLGAALLWLTGLDAPLPKFRLDDHHTGDVIPVHWPWWRQAADWLHGRRYLVLTFDDGPADHATNTAILHILAKHHAHAIFFTICGRTEAHGRPVKAQINDLRADVAAGNLVGDHTYTHPHLPKTHGAVLRHEIVGCQETLYHITGRRVRWFRPPFGQTNPTVLGVVREAGMRQMLWLDNSEDTWQQTPAEIKHWSTTMASNGAILLMHSKPTTAAALDGALTALERMGYRFVLPAASGPDN